MLIFFIVVRRRQFILTQHSLVKRYFVPEGFLIIQKMLQVSGFKLVILFMSNTTIQKYKILYLPTHIPISYLRKLFIVLMLKPDK